MITTRLFVLKAHYDNDKYFCSHSYAVPRDAVQYGLYVGLAITEMLLEMVIQQMLFMYFVRYICMHVIFLPLWQLRPRSWTGLPAERLT
jgi:hypothetical protein